MVYFRLFKIQIERIVALVFGLVADFYSLLLFALDFWIVVIYRALISFAGSQNILKMFAFYLFNEKEAKFRCCERILVLKCLGIFLSVTS